MDILKELFGTCDELQINKSLFGSEVGHGDISLDQSHALTRENVQRPLPLLPSLRPPSNPPPLPLLPVDPHPHHTPIVRSHSLDNLHSNDEGSDEKDLLGNYRSDSFRSQSAFTRFNANAATAHVDLHSVPQETPMYLLQEDEGNDEEIMRLMGASREASSRGDSPSDSGSGEDVTEGGVQVVDAHMSEQCLSSVQANASETCVSNLVITNAIGSVVMTEEENYRELQLLVNETTSEVPMGDHVNGSASLVDDVISEMDIGKLDTSISSFLGLTASPTVAQTEVQTLSSSSDVIHGYSVPVTESLDVDIPAPKVSGSNNTSTPNTYISTGSELQLRPASVEHSQVSQHSATVSLTSRPFNSASSHTTKESRASHPLENSNNIQEHLDVAKSTSLQRTSQYNDRPASAKALKSKMMMVNEGTQTTKDVHKRRLSSGHSSRGTVTPENARQASRASEDHTRHLDRSSLLERQQMKFTTRQSTTQSNGRKQQSAMPKEPHTSKNGKDSSPCDSDQHSAVVTPTLIPSPMMSSAMHSADSSMQPPLDATTITATSPTAINPVAPILQSVSPAEPLMSALPRLDTPLQKTLPTLPSTATQAVTSSSASSIPTSTVSTPLLTSSAHLQLARSLLNLSSLSIPTIIPLSVSGSSEPAIAVPLPSSLVSLASTSLPTIVASQASPTAVRLQPGRSRSNFLPTSTSMTTRCTKQAGSSSAINHGGIIEPLTVARAAPLGLNIQSPSPDSCAVTSSNTQQYLNGLQDTSAVNRASVHGIDISANASAEKTQRTASTEPLEVQPTALTQIVHRKEGEGVERDDLTPQLQKESELHSPKSSTSSVATPNGIMLLPRHEKQPNIATEFGTSLSNPSQTSGFHLPTISQGIQDSNSSKSPDANLMIPSAISIHFPVMDQKGNQVRGQILGLEATPIELIHISTNESQEASSHQKKKRRHGGGWPKGKRRKVDDEPKPPKPPSTGYRLFLSEKWSEVQRETGCQSSPHLSKKLGHMWSALSKEEKESYCVKAGLDRRRYLEELKIYLEKTYEENSTVQFETLDKFLSQSFENETDDDILICQLCELTFTSLHNKRCHYSGKSHTEALWQELNKLLGRTKGPQKKGKKTCGSKVCKSAVAPTQEVSISQNVCTEPVYMSVRNPNDEPTNECISTEINHSEVEVGWDEATDNTTRASATVNHRKQQDTRRPHIPESDIQNTNPPCSTSTTVNELVHTLHSAVDNSSLCSSCMSATPSKPVDIDACTIRTLSSPISSVTSEKHVDGESVRTSKELLHPAPQGSMNVLLEHCEDVSSCFKDFASRTTANMQALYEQRKLHSELLNEYSTLQQQCDELEYFCSCCEEELALEDDTLCEQLANLLSLFKYTGNTTLVAKLESAMCMH